MPPDIRSRASDRGSLLIVAMIFSAIIGISLVSYLQLARSSLVISNLAFYNNTAMNLAENGLEEAMYALNLGASEQAINWQNWSIQSGAASRRFPSATTSYQLDAVATGTVRVRIENYGAYTPTIIARATISVGGGSNRTVEKWVKVSVQRTSIFANGLVAKRQIIFRGSVSSVDSWNSDPDNTPATAVVPYSNQVRAANGTVASTSIEVNQVMIMNAAIRGFAATGGAAPVVGTQGLIGDFTTPAGTVVPERVSSDFAANFDPVNAPPAPPTGQPALPPINGNTSLPRANDTAVEINGVPTYSYRTDRISLSSGTLRIRKPNPNTPDFNVVITLTNDNTSATVSGTGEISLAAGTSLHLFAPGDVTIGGRGILNGGTVAQDANPPANFQVWGTRTETQAAQFGLQSITLLGNGVLSAVAYAPFGSLSVDGNGDLLGSMVADNITFNGNINFHYDEALSRFSTHATFQKQPYRILNWQELTSVNARQNYAAVMSF